MVEQQQERILALENSLDRYTGRIGKQQHGSHDVANEQLNGVMHGRDEERDCHALVGE